MSYHKHGKKFCRRSCKELYERQKAEEYQQRLRQSKFLDWLRHPQT